MPDPVDLSSLVQLWTLLYLGIPRGPLPVTRNGWKSWKGWNFFKGVLNRVLAFWVGFFSVFTCFFLGVGLLGYYLLRWFMVQGRIPLQVGVMIDLEEARRKSVGRCPPQSALQVQKRYDK